MPDLTVQEMRILKERVFKAAEAGDVEAILDSLKDADEQVCKEVLHHRSKKDGGSLTPLMIAALGGHREVVRLLLEVYGVAVDQTGTLVPGQGEEVTALWCASSSGLLRRDIFELLLDRGANINHMDAEGFETPLLQACKKGDAEVIDFLVSHGADVNLPTRNGQTPLIEACQNGDVKSAEKLVNLGADVNQPTMSGQTPLMESILYLPPACAKIVEFLLQHGADPNRQDSWKLTALHHAAQNQRLDIMNVLVDNGAIIMRTSKGMTPTLYALLEDDEEWEVPRRFLQHPRIPRQDKVDALEAAGALLCLKDLDGGYPFLVEAMEERFSDPENILSKPLSPPIAALGNIVESQTLEELEARRREPYTLLMECVFILQRAYGEVYCPWMEDHLSRVCLELLRLDRSDAILPLRHYLMLRHPKHVSDLLVGASYSIVEMLNGGKAPKFCEMKPLMDCAMETWQNGSDHNEKGKGSEWDSHEKKLLGCLDFCKAVILCVKGTAEEKQVAALVQQMVSVLDEETSKLPISLMHVVVKDLKVSLHCDGLSQISLDMSLIHLLMDSGACVNAVNEDGNTPLAVLTSFPLSQKPHHSETVKNVVEMLMKAGAHLDCQDAHGRMPLDTEDAEMEAILREFCPLSLACLASRAVLKHKLPYQSCLPEVVQNFVQLHEQKPSIYM